MKNNAEQTTFRALARSAKSRMKNGFWKECKENVEQKMQEVKRQGLNESKAGRYLKEQVCSRLSGEKEDEFYLKVKAMLSLEGEPSDAIGRLTDKAYYETLSYEEKQRYNLSISEKYLRAVARYKKEREFSSLSGEENG